MQKDEITAIFDRQAAAYDQQWSRLAPINGALHLLTTAVLSGLSPTARILCVGAGTGAEILHLAQTFPGWQFTAVEPSLPMLEVLQSKAEAAGISSRCVFHPGYLDSLPPTDPFDAATAFLVSQFLLDPALRVAFFREIAQRLRPEGILVSSDLAGDLRTAECQNLLEVWFKVMAGGGISEEGIQRMREAYTTQVAVIPPGSVRDLIARAAFEPPVQFFQAGLIHGWYARRLPGELLNARDISPRKLRSDEEETKVAPIGDDFRESLG